MNEDSYLCVCDPQKPDWLNAVVAVADGMGGRQNGHIASAVAVQAVREAILGTNRFYSPSGALELLGESFAAAHEQVRKAAGDDPLLLEMGTTLTIGAIGQRRLFLGSLGDSRAYLHRGSRFVQLTVDDWFRAPAEPGTPVMGEVTVVDQAVGWEGDIQPRKLAIEVGADDLLVFCTDGLTDALSERQIEEILVRNRRRLDVALKRLLEAASKVQDADNITVGLVRIDGR